MTKKPFSFKFFTAALGYHREVRKGKGVYVKKLDRKRSSVISHEVFMEEYKKVCERMADSKEEKTNAQ